MDVLILAAIVGYLYLMEWCDRRELRARRMMARKGRRARA